MLYLDSETCGLQGFPVLLQYAVDEGPIILYDIWKNPIIDTLKLIEWMLEQEVCGFNLAFDIFQLCKVYTTFLLYPDSTAYPEDIIEELALLEPQARNGPCLKFKACLDLMLYARKGPYQKLMNRDPVSVRRVPTQLAWHLAAELEKRVVLDDIFFARRKDKHAPRWVVKDIENTNEFKDIVLSFSASGALKTLAKYVLKIEAETILKYSDVDVNKAFWPNELGYAPFALAIGKPGNWNGAWPEKIEHYIKHWAYRDDARRYASNDIDYTRRLRHHFGDPPAGDDDSELAGLVAACRWKGFAFDRKRILRLRKAAMLRQGTTPMAPGPVKRYIEPFLTEMEKVVIDGSTDKQVLEDIAGWTITCKCSSREITGQPPDIIIKDSCKLCKGTGKVRHPAAPKAEEVLEARHAKKEVELYDKLLLAGRFHASFNVIGTKSSRMSGTDDLNPQAIQRVRRVRRAFTFADPGECLTGGDFDSFEVVIAEATYGDPQLRLDLQSGKKIHALFAEELFPGKTYDWIMKNQKITSHYTDGKQGIFAIIYGGNEQTLKNRLGVDIETANAAYGRFIKRYPKIGEARLKIFNLFCSMRQPKGIGTKVEWHEPADYIDSMLGFKRYFTVENKICKALFELAQNPPKAWKEFKFKITRRDREQSVYGAVQSALYAAAFNIQSSNMRAAANHVIQATGAKITKTLQRNIWNLQPSGIHNWIVQPFNSHDELEAVTQPTYVDQIKDIVRGTVDSFKDRIPLIKMEWNSKMKTWADK